jgi:hypothetical protein
LIDGLLKELGLENGDWSNMTAAFDAKLNGKSATGVANIGTSPDVSDSPVNSEKL